MMVVLDLQHLCLLGARYTGGLHRFFLGVHLHLTATSSWKSDFVYGSFKHAKHSSS